MSDASTKHAMSDDVPAAGAAPITDTSPGDAIVPSVSVSDVTVAESGAPAAAFTMRNGIRRPLGFIRVGGRYPFRVLRRAAEITPEWLTKVFQHRGLLEPWAKVATAEIKPMGEGLGVMGDIVFVTVTCEGGGEKVPKKFIAKFSPQENLQPAAPSMRPVGEEPCPLWVAQLSPPRRIVGERAAPVLCDPLNLRDGGALVQRLLDRGRGAPSAGVLLDGRQIVAPAVVATVSCLLHASRAASSSAVLAGLRPRHTSGVAPRHGHARPPPLALVGAC